jgi:hypothetical protein
VWQVFRPRAGGAPEGRLRPFLELILGLVVARFPAVNAIVLAVFRKANAKVRVAESAILVAGAALLRLIANDAMKFLPDHRVTASPSRSRSLFAPALLSAIDDAKSTRRLPGAALRDLCALHFTSLSDLTFTSLARNERRVESD